MPDHPTCVAIIGGMTVLFGVYAVVRLLRFLADVVILLIALSCATLGCTMHLWYAKLAAHLEFLPSDFGLKGWAICVGLLTVLGVLLALPIAAFSTSLGDYVRPVKPLPPEPRQHPTNTSPQPSPLYQWDNINDRI